MKNKVKNDHLYIIQSSDAGMIKIGRSIHPDVRLKQLQTGHPAKLKLIHVFENMGYKEKYLHECLKSFRKKGEWFDYECVGSIPVEFYEIIPWGKLDEWNN